jgi:curved DNA-binding protein CbpA
MDPYEVLGVPPDATVEQVNLAYRQRARETHPDAHGGDTDAFAEVAAAGEILRDPERRARYDRTGRTNADGLSPDQRAASIVFTKLLQMFSTALEQEAKASMEGRPFDLEKIDFVASLRAVLDKEIENGEAAQQNMRNEIGKMERLAGRIKGGTLAVRIETMIVGHMRMMDLGIAEADEKPAPYRLARDMLADLRDAGFRSAAIMGFGWPQDFGWPP